MGVDTTSAQDPTPKPNVKIGSKQVYVSPVLTNYGAALHVTMSATGGRNDPGSGSKTRTQ
jgi:hypothetical protein